MSWRLYDHSPARRISSSTFASEDSSFPSDVSTVTSLTSSPSSSLYTTTTTETVWGPGALTGKALLAFGKITLRGIEVIVIRWKVLRIHSYFPHSNDALPSNAEHLYDMVLELSRPGLYHIRFRQQALRLIVIQIATIQTSYLIDSLRKWPSVEIHLFVSELMLCLHAEWTGLRSIRHDIHREMMDVYLSSLTGAQDNHEATPLIKFIKELARAGRSCLQALLDAGILDMFLCMYLHDFLPCATPPIHADWKPRRSSLLASCSSTIEAIAVHGGVQILQGHPLFTLWPKSTVNAGHFKERRAIWHTLDKELVLWRLQTIFNVIFLSADLCDGTTDVLDAFDDLLEFASSDKLDKEISTRALTHLFGCVGKNRSTIANIVSVYLANNSYDSSVDIIHRIIHRVLKFDCVSSQRSVDQSAPQMDNISDLVIRIGDQSPSGKETLQSFRGPCTHIFAGYVRHDPVK